MILLHLSDLHLGAKCARLGARDMARRADLLRAFDAAVDKALGVRSAGAGILVAGPAAATPATATPATAAPAGPIDLVLVTGDLFDRHKPEGALVSHVGSALDRLTTAGIQVVLLPGTHDGYGYTDSVYRSLSRPAGVHLLTTPVLSAGPVLDVRGTPVHLYGVAYDPARTRNPWGSFRRGESPGVHIALIHGSLEGNPEWEMRNRDLPIPASVIRDSGMDYVAFGHYHNFHEGKEGATVWCYPGTLEGLKWGEWGERYLVTVELEPSASGEPARVRVRRTPYPGRRIEEWEIDLDRTGIATDDALAKEIRSRAADAAGNRIVRALVRGRRPPGLDLARVEETLAAEFFHIVLEDRLRSHDPALRELARGERTVRGLFLRRMEDRIDAAPDDAERARLERALQLGLEALQGEAAHAD